MLFLLCQKMLRQQTNSIELKFQSMGYYHFLHTILRLITLKPHDLILCLIYYLRLQMGIYLVTQEQHVQGILISIYEYVQMMHNWLYQSKLHSNQHLDKMHGLLIGIALDPLYPIFIQKQRCHLFELLFS